MENNSITWLRIKEITGITYTDLLKKLIIPSLKFTAKSTKKPENTNKTTNSSSPNKKKQPYDYSDFIAGKDLTLSLNFLDKYCAAAEMKKETSEGSSEKYFYGGLDHNGILSAVKCWNEFDSLLITDPLLDRKIIRNDLKSLIKQPTTLTVSLPTGDILNLNTCLNSVVYEDVSYQFAAYSIIASTWPVWELVSTNSREDILTTYTLDRDLLCQKLKLIYEVITPHRITLSKILDSLLPSCTQYYFVNTLIAPTMLNSLPANDSESGTYISEDSFSFNKSDLSRLFNGKLLRRSKEFLKIITMPDLSKEPFSKRLLYYHEYIYLKTVRSTWESYLKNNPDSVASLSSLLSNYYESFAKDKWIVRFSCENEYIDLIEELYSIKEQPSYWDESYGDFFIYKLSVFFVIAITWAVWEKCTDAHSSKHQITDDFNKYDDIGRHRILLKNLVKLLFPRPYVEASTSNNSEEYSSDDADKLYEDAVVLLDDKHDHVAAGKQLVKIIYHYSSLASNETLRNTYSLIEVCRSRGFNTPKWLGSPDDIKNEALKYGTLSAKTLIHEIKPQRNRAKSQESGFYYVKCSNRYISYWINSTIPSNWKPLIAELEQLLQKNNSVSNTEPAFERANLLTNNIRFIFAEDNFDENVNDALSLLEKLRILTVKDGAQPELWGRIELVIRCEQEKTSPLLDTACSFLGQTYDDGTPLFHKNPIRIHLLDDKKRSADLLYARHPLFYPLTFSKNKDNIEKRRFNLVIVSNNEDITHAVWLIRQAFWLLPHNRISVPSKITILSPNYKAIALMLTSLCPGLSQFITCNGLTPDSDVVKIDDITFPWIECHNLQINTRDLESFVEKEIVNDSLLYYVIDASSDFEAINLGTHIREISIRKALRKKHLKYYSSDETVIAIRCNNSDYANLANQLIVPKEEEHDNRWFNDYKLISYGSIKDLFSWDELTGGVIEFMSECMHLQYCTASGEDYDYNSEAPVESIWSYYRRFYNRDSSYSAAISMPYRLFEANVLLRPSEWILSDSNAYWSEENRNILADRFSKEVINESLYRWEHSRFCCYLLSTGWLPASPEQVRYYMNNGVSRHTLQIARLHPCLCSWDSLIDLYELLHKAYIGTKDAYDKYTHNDKFKKFSEDDPEYFQRLDIDNIYQTADILRARPLPLRTKQAETDFDSTTK